MATRRSLADLSGGEQSDDGFMEMLSSFGSQPGGVKLPGPGSNAPRDLTGPGPDESGEFGNRESARELAGQQMPTTLNLPRGVTVEDQMPEPMNMGDMFSGPEAAQSFDTPAAPKAPTPTASRAPDPYVTPSESGAAPQGGPARRGVSSAPAALFGERASNPMFGQAGGLLGGGLGVQGSGGGPEPTEMMLNILRMMKRGQMV